MCSLHLQMQGVVSDTYDAYFASTHNHAPTDKGAEAYAPNSPIMDATCLMPRMKSSIMIFSFGA